ncbi:hypothetical protein Pst134EA_020826 [Puccinia striiformis f. sp. tritici]|uniref:hypothetical protein n=1 Tax=Puccinia striiformis f. sp. tritici TaxID=168172 RepID=UPI002007787E|nr:hypothetical protein Pst134EA_020826 [Puccinia striiformis f. sp. tritici]KAH9456919.1 hypothetical protein Pst134EA_020826 [Puccinia striiformis f. sp. tritici]
MPFRCHQTDKSLLASSQPEATSRAPPAAGSHPRSPASFRQFHLPSRLTARFTKSSTANFHQSPTAVVSPSPTTGLSRTNATRRGHEPTELNNIEINGDLVSRLLGLKSRPACLSVSSSVNRPSNSSYEGFIARLLHPSSPPLPHPFQTKKPSHNRRRKISMVPADVREELWDIHT